MVKQFKSSLEEDEKITTEKDYLTGNFRKKLFSDCHDKCYICEDNSDKSHDVEHIIPHRGDLAIKYDWNNMLLSCAYCNKIKGDKFDKIINPILCDPEEHIALVLETLDFKTRVRITQLKQHPNAEQTVGLLEYVYNGSFSEWKDMEIPRFSYRLKEDIQEFTNWIENYSKDNCTKKDREGYCELIKKNIARSSIFAAFKRKIIRDNPKLSEQFSEMLNIDKREETVQKKKII